MSTDAADKKTFDVSRPGKTPPEPTGRPVIVTNRSMVKDPILKFAEGQSASNFDPAKPAVNPQNIKSEAKPVAPLGSVEASEPEPTAPTFINHQVDQQRIDERQQAELSEAQKVRQEKVKELIASGTYAVPTGHIKRNRKLRKTLMVVILVTVLGFVAGDLLIDAGIIKTNIKPIVDLIKN